MNRDEYGIPAEAERRLLEGLRSLGAEVRHREAPPRVERRLVDALRARSGGTRSPFRWWMVGGWAAALTVTAALAFFLIGGRQPDRSQRAGSLRRAAQGTIVEQPVEMDALAELGADFIPLPNAQRIAPDDPVNFVRVELPRSAIVALGIADEGPSEEPVEADVVLGPDGTARAVRFLD